MSRRDRLAVALLTGFLLALAPEIASACPMCFQASSEENRVAFILSTAFLSFLPLLLIGGVIWWVRRRVLAADAAERSESGRAPRPLPQRS